MRKRGRLGRPRKEASQEAGQEQVLNPIYHSAHQTPAETWKRGSASQKPKLLGAEKMGAQNALSPSIKIQSEYPERLSY